MQASWLIMINWIWQRLRVRITRTTLSLSLELRSLKVKRMSRLLTALLLWGSRIPVLTQILFQLTLGYLNCKQSYTKLVTKLNSMAAALSQSLRLKMSLIFAENLPLRPNSTELISIMSQDLSLMTFKTIHLRFSQLILNMSCQEIAILTRILWLHFWPITQAKSKRSLTVLSSLSHNVKI